MNEQLTVNGGSPASVTYTNDGLKSLIGNLGNPDRDKGASLEYQAINLSETELAAAYSGSWVARKIVDIPARDSLKKWRTWNTDFRAEIEEEERRLDLRAKILDARIKSRLYGAAGTYFGTAQDPEEPLDIESVKQGEIEYLTVLARSELTAGEIEQDPLSKEYGKPKFYEIRSRAGQVRIHPSRLIIFVGNDRADTLSTASSANWGGEPVLYSCIDAIKQFSGTTSNVASLIFEANIDILGIKNLMEQLGSTEGENQLLKRFTLAGANKGINGMLMLDAEETYERKPAQFAELTTIMETLALFCAAAADIPATRFLARSPSGLVATGNHDSRNYRDQLLSQQTLEIGPAMYDFDQCMIRSALGSYPEDVNYGWNPLEQQDEKELAEIGKVVTESLKNLDDMGIYMPEELKAISNHRLAETNAFPHIEQVISETREALSLEEEIPEPEEAGE